MERIQAAIAKAREERQNQAGTGAARKRSSGTTKAERDALWNALPEFQPKVSLLQRNRIMTFQNSPEATTFDIARTRVLRQVQEHGWRRMAITSPTPSCGKSTISVNLAMSIARQKDVRAILIEADMRRPTISDLLGEVTRRSVSDLLSGKAEFADCAIRIGQNLALVTQEQGTRDASDILLAGRVAGILSEIEARYAPDLIICDTPPLLINDDTLAFLAHMDCSLLVAAAGTTKIKELDNCERELAAQTNVMGIVLNKARYIDKSSYAYSYDYDNV